MADFKIVDVRLEPWFVLARTTQGAPAFVGSAPRDVVAMFEVDLAKQIDFAAVRQWMVSSPKLTAVTVDIASGDAMARLVKYVNAVRKTLADDIAGEKGSEINAAALRYLSMPGGVHEKVGSTTRTLTNDTTQWKFGPWQVDIANATYDFEAYVRLSVSLVQV